MVHCGSKIKINMKRDSDSFRRRLKRSCQNGISHYDCFERDFVMKRRSNLEIPKKEIADFCKRNQIVRLSFFGSVLRQDFGPESDLDVLVEFETQARIGLIRLVGMEMELGKIVGRKVDLNTPGFISKYFRDQVLAEAEVQYDAA
jgi:predicted nucleotidyltransferase